MLRSYLLIRFLLQIWNCSTVVSQADPIESVQLRLTNAGSQCAGRVEIHYNGSWGTLHEFLWDLEDAAVVCRELGCGVALAAPIKAFFGEGSGPFVTGSLKCGVNETALRNCESHQWGHFLLPHSNDAGIICAGDTKPRLVNGNSPCAGRLEVYQNRTWRTICSDEAWALAAADVVCQELGCGSGAVAQMDAHFGEGTGPVIGPPGCGHQRDLGVICSGTVAPRLVNGNSACDGRLEIYANGTWRTVCGVGSWALSSLDFVCKELNCGSAVEAPLNAHFGEGSGPVIGQPGCSHQQDIGVICSESKDLRLVSADSRCSGRLEIRQRQQWGTVCDRYFDVEDAAVVCAHLRCGTVAGIQGRAHFGKGTGPVWNQKYMCRGYEARLWDCPISPWDRIRCSHESDVSVICSDKNWVPRLTNGGSRCDGRVEIYYNRSWGKVQDNLWDIKDANVTCRELGCGYAISAYNSSKYGEGEGPVWVNEVTCQGNESQLQMCNSFTLNPFLDDSGGVGVLCSEHIQLRLTGGVSPCAGRVEVYYGGAWGSVCDDSWDPADAQVVCRQLGCGNALQTKRSGHCEQSSDPMWLDELSCSGDESFLWQCPSAPWGKHDCVHKEDAMVMCSEHKELQLVNGKHRCEGRVEVFYNGSWGTVCSETLDVVDAEIICKQLQCGPVQNIQYDVRTFGAGSGSIWLDEVACDSHELTLWQCQSDAWGEHNCEHREDAGVVCSEARKPTASLSLHNCLRESGLTHEPSPGQRLRLVGGNSSCTGRVEILSNNSWGTVCDDSWDLADADVVCRQLGCGSALSAAGGAAFAQGDGVIWLDEVKCTGIESFLSDCGSSPPGQDDCDHKEDAGVTCSGLDLPPPDSPSSAAGGWKGKAVSIPATVCITLGSLLVCELIALGALTWRMSSRRGHVIFGRDSPVGIYDAIYQEVESIQRSEVSSQIERSGEVCFEFEDGEDGTADTQYSSCQLPYDSDEFLNIANSLYDHNELSQ